jgi:phospholipid transport system substrate-binding protein
MSTKSRQNLLPGLIGLAMLIPFFAGVARAETAASDPAVNRIEAFYAALVETMKQGPQLGIDGRYKKLKPVIEASFNLPIMTKFVVGPSWAAITTADQKLLIDAFERMTIASYAKNFASFGGEKFTVEPETQVRGLDHIVSTTLEPTDHPPVPLIYRMRDAGGAWKIIDVYLNGTISEAGLRRSEFSMTVKTGGAEALIKKINEASDRLMAPQ